MKPRITDVVLPPTFEQTARAAPLVWRTMDSAPKDGTDIVLAAIDQVFRGEPMPDRVTVGHWTTDDECREVIGDCGGECRCPEYKFHEPSWISWDGGFTEENPPTHWMSLPEPPTCAIAAAKGGSK